MLEPSATAMPSDVVVLKTNFEQNALRPFELFSLVKAQICRQIPSVEPLKDPTDVKLDIELRIYI